MEVDLELARRCLEFAQKTDGTRDHIGFGLQLINEVESLRAKLSASSDTTDWCPLCKQGWDCAKNEQRGRVKLHKIQAILTAPEAKETDED